MERWSEAQLHVLDFQKLPELIYSSRGIHLVPAKKTMVELRRRRLLHHQTAIKAAPQDRPDRGGQRFWATAR